MTRERISKIVGNRIGIRGLVDTIMVMAMDTGTMVQVPHRVLSEA